MQFSLRTFLVVVLLVAAVLGAVAAYRAAWVHHCQKMEPLVFRVLLMEEIDSAPLPFEFEHNGVTYRSDELDEGVVEFEPIYFAYGRDENGDWKAPTKAMIEQIGLSSVKSVSDMGELDVVHYIDNIRWVDWDTVLVDFGMYGGPLYGGGSIDIKLQRVNREWRVVEVGSFWVS